MSDEIRRWSEELARDPASMVFVPLGDALRRRGQLEPALKVATRGLERHPYDADAHDLLARIHADRGDMERAMDEWGAALRVAPHHAGALKGMGFACFQNGRATEAERYLVAAVGADPGDPTIDAALSRLRAPQTRHERREHGGERRRRRRSRHPPTLPPRAPARSPVERPMRATSSRTCWAMANRPRCCSTRMATCSRERTWSRTAAMSRRTSAAR